MRCDGWEYYTPEQVQARVERTAEAAILHEAIAIACERGVSELPRWRGLLQQAGHLAAQACWRDELAAAWRRLRTGESGSHDGDVDVVQMRRRLEDLAYREVCP